MTKPNIMHNTESIDSYKSAIERLAESNSELVFDNSGVQHAAIVLSNIFRNSKNIVRIYAHDMNGEISLQKCYKDSINNYLACGGKLNIIIDNQDNLSDTIKEIVNNKNVETKLSSKSFQSSLSNVSKNGSSYHFAVGDDKMIRIELDENSHKAICSFNLPDISNTFISLFDKFFPQLPKANIIA